MNDRSMIATWQAQGVLMERHELSAEQAMEFLRDAARRAGRTIDAEARQVLLRVASSGSE